MRFVVVNSNKGTMQRECHRLGRPEPDHQSAGQAGALRGTDSFQAFSRNTSLPKSGLRNRDQIAQMFPGRQFGHYSAVFSVQPDLRRNYVREDGVSVDDSRAGFIARSLEGEEHSSFRRSHLIAFGDPAFRGGGALGE